MGGLSEVNSASAELRKSRGKTIVAEPGLTEHTAFVPREWEALGEGVITLGLNGVRGPEMRLLGLGGYLGQPMRVDSGVGCWGLATMAVQVESGHPGCPHELQMVTATPACRNQASASGRAGCGFWQPQPGPGIRAHFSPGTSGESQIKP